MSERIKLIKPLRKLKYPFQGKIKILNYVEQKFEGKVIPCFDLVLDCGLNLLIHLGLINIDNLKNMGKELKTGDYISIEGRVYLYESEF
ncbi:MAG: hypothetical protein SVJ22_05135 [Halobacteriota archaeon]|nr:hypothetical protein [Halobacteriota archaeon]